MLNRSIKLIFLWLVALSANIIHSGFVTPTQICTPHGSVAIQDISVDDEVIAYTTEGRLVTTSIIQKHQHEIETLVVLHINEILLEVSPQQLFYLPNQRCWQTAQKLVAGDLLLSAVGNTTTIKKVEYINKSTHVYCLTLADHYTYCVSPLGIIVHNHPLVVGGIFTAAAETAAPNLLTVLLTAHPLIAPITISIGGAGIIWAIANGVKQAHKESRNKQHTNERVSGSIQPPQDPKKNRKTEKYNNMYEVYDKTEVGKILKKASEPTRWNWRGAKIYRTTKNIPEFGIKKGDLYYLDKLHGDHIEVFNHNGSAVRTILNMDGTPNIDKIIKAGIRSIEECIN